MKLVIDLTIIKNINQITGIERVALESSKYVIEKLASFEENSLHIICSKKGSMYIKREFQNHISKKNIKFYSSPYTNRIFTDQLWLPFIIDTIKPDNVYYTTLGIPIINKYPFCFIIHDAVAWAIPDTISKGMKYYYRPLLERAVKNRMVKKVITVSNFSKKEIVNYLKVDESKIVVNHLGVSNKFNFSNRMKDEVQISRNPIINTSKDYIITIGTLEPRKNLQRLIEAFRILKQEYGYSGSLMIVGREGWLNSLVIHEDIKDYVIFTGYVKDIDLYTLLKKAQVYVFPSLYEGFGLPLVEAMQLGIPIASSNSGSLPEVGQSACEYFDPYDIDDMAAKINIILSVNGKKEEYSKMGLTIAKNYTWEKHGKRLLNAILGETI
ncbi:glycosyltransferase family 4 protein [Neobacillus sp. C211]|uniref:glycosyltransferase family 4 protein n=1 Tax=unclassified Neobacillus TaxID=2675272 RepID=UPI00397CF0F1